MTTAPAPENSPRVVLLGASNLTRSISTVVETCRLMLGSPIEIFAALGHGRSYGKDSTVLFRTLPGILHCGLWDALKGQRETSVSREPTGERSAPPTFALITDIGNDIMYGESPSTIIKWVAHCIDRLADHNARIAMSTIPIQSIRALKPWKYRIVKAMLFPTRALTFSQAIDRATELHAQLEDLSRRRAITLIEPSPYWYGFDPIHIRMTHWPAAWRTLLARTFDLEAERQPQARCSLVRWVRLRTTRPQQVRILGREMKNPQPGARLRAGISISLY